MTHYTPRDYQQSAIEAALNFVKYRAPKSGYVTAPGGSGKSIMIAKMAEHLYDMGYRVVILARNEKLLTQNRDKLAPPYQEQAGIYCAGLGYKETDKPIIIASAQSIFGQTLPEIDKPLICLVDECDEINPDSEGDTQYWQFFRNNGNPRIIGFTATNFRTASGTISWGEEIIRIPIAPLVEQGHIVPPINKIGAEPNLDAVEVTSMGEYNATQLGAIYEDPELLRVSVEKVLEYGASRKHILIFCQNIAHCDAIATALGDEAITVTGDTDKEELTLILEDFSKGMFKYLINCQLLTVGVDLPCIDMIVLLMATKSKRKFEQAVYRGTRPYEGKESFLLLDMGMNLYEHGALGSPYKGRGKREANKQQGKICPECEEWVEQAGAKECTSCGYEFILIDPAKVKHSYDADTESDTIYTPPPDKQIHDVTAVTYKQKDSKAGNPMIVVEYHCNYGKYGTLAEFLLPHHEKDFVRDKVFKFYRERGLTLMGDLRTVPMVDLIHKAENDLPKVPTQIMVDHSGSFPKVLNCFYDDPVAPLDTDDILDGDSIPF